MNSSHLLLEALGIETAQKRTGLLRKVGISAGTAAVSSLIEHLTRQLQPKEGDERLVPAMRSAALGVAVARLGVIASGAVENLLGSDEEELAVIPDSLAEIRMIEDQPGYVPSQAELVLELTEQDQAPSK